MTFGIVTIMFFGDFKLGLVLMLIWALRIYFLKIPHFVYVNLFFALLAVLVCGFNVHRLHQQLIPQRAGQSLILKVDPDELKLNGDEYSGRAYSYRYHQKVLIFGYLKSSRDQRQLQHVQKASFWRVDGDVTKIDPPTNVNQFNSQRYFKSLGITNSVKIDQIKAFQPCNPLNPLNLIHNFRQNLIVKAKTLPHYLSTYTLSLFLGITDKSMNPELAGVKQLGLIHLFSISGLHVYFLINVLELIFIYLHFKRENYRLALVMILPAYFIFAGASIGLLRSVLMVEIGLVSRYFKTRWSSLNVWSIALLINLILEPRMLIQFGCQLSYILSFGLIYTRRFNFVRKTFLMNLISFPLIIYNVFDWHFLTIAANLLILPLFSTVVFPMVIVGSVLGYFIPVIARVVSALIRTLDWSINLIGNLPGNVDFGKPSVILISFAVILTLYLVAHPNRKLLISLLTLYVLMFGLVHFPVQGEVAYFDVGQGDSFLVRQPFNQNVTMIDTGGKLNFGHHQPSYQADQTSINYLKSIGIDHLDNVCISHQDSDHCGDLPEILRQLKVKRVLIPWGMDHNSHFMGKIRPYLGQTQLLTVKSGDHVPGLPFQILHPFHPGLGSNADSMVLSGSFGGKRWLFMGDLDQPGELSILDHYPNLHTDVLKLGHHGSKTASAPRFLDTVDPQFAVISAGRHNRYHHPDPEVVNRVKRRGIKIFNTQNNGMIYYRFSGDHGNWQTVEGK